MYGHDAKHTFRTDLLGPATPNLLTPVTDLVDKITSQPTVSPSGMFVVGAGFSAWGVRADGRLLWGSRLAADARWSSAAFDTNGFFYMGDRGNALQKKDYTTGTTDCRFIITSQDGDIRASPTVSVKYPDRVYVGESGVAGGLFAIRTSGPSECSLVWSLKISGASPDGVALEDSVPGNGDSLGNLIYAASRTIYAVVDNDSSATIVNQRNLGGDLTGSSPVIDPATGNIFIGTNNNKFYALRPDLSDVFPPLTIETPIQTSAALSPDGSTVYVETYRGLLHAFDTTTGTERIGFPYDPPTKGNQYLRNNAPVVDGAGNIYIAGTDKHVRALRPDGSVIWDATVGGGVTAAPVLVDGGLVVASMDSKVYRFCAPPSGPPNALDVCGFTIDTTSPN
jgi:hypothetical protein